MRTDDLVRLLAADARRATPLRTAVPLAAIASGAAACLAFVAIIGVRPELLSAMSDPRVAFKFAFAASVATAAVAYGLRVIRPEDRPSGFVFGVPVLALLLIGVVVETSVTPIAAWPSAALGFSPFRCVGLIVATSLLPIAALLQAMRPGAPARPGVAGAAAGLGGGAIGAMVFALYCPNDSVLFVAIWYVLALGNRLRTRGGARCKEAGVVAHQMIARPSPRRRSLA